MFEQGSLWRQWDLHIHTPASFNWSGQRFAEMNEEAVATCCDALLTRMEESNVAVFGIMDYWTFDGYLTLKRRLSSANDLTFSKTLLPGIELRIEAPTDNRLNIHALFPEDVSEDALDQFFHMLRIRNIDRVPTREGLIQLARSLGNDKLKFHGFKPEEKGNDERMFQLGCQVATITPDSLEKAIKTFSSLKPLVIVPYDAYGGLEPLDWHKHAAADQWFFRFADIFEDRKPENVHLFNGVVTDGNRAFIKDFIANLGGRPKPVISGSDAHKPSRYGIYPNSRPTWIKANPTFAGLRQTLHEPAGRVYIGAVPPQADLIRKHPTKYISGVRIRKQEGSALTDHWFNCELPVNPGLVAIIGNKGSGKSAIADILALCGNARCGRMEFLNEDRFWSGENPAREFIASVTWQDNTTTPSRPLSDSPDRTQPARVRYLPQKHIEDLCNEVQEGPGSRFEQELKEVIFEHIPLDQRLGTHSLDALLRFKTEELEGRMSRIRQDLLTLNFEIVDIEHALSDEAIRSLNNSIELLQNQLRAHNATRPAPVASPPVAPDEAAMAIAATMNAKASEREALTNKKTELEADRATTMRQVAVIDKVAGRLRNIRQEWQTTVEAVASDAAELNIPVASLLAFQLNFEPLTALRASGVERLAKIQYELEGDDETPGLLSRIQSLDIAVAELRAQLSEPDRLYRTYLDEINAWREQRRAILGDVETPNTLNYLYTKARNARDVLPARLADALIERLRLVKQLHGHLLEAKAEYERLFQPVQDLISTELAAMGGLDLQFAASVRPMHFEDRFLATIDRGRRGTFYGVTEGKEQLLAITSQCDFNDSDSVVQMVQTCIDCLYQDARTGEQKNPSAQLRRDVTLLEMFTFVYGLEYLEPHYVLKLQGNDINMLSPGEKGALLIAFYLLLDPIHVPLIIDQPEQNLDNESVYKLLVPCFKLARTRRQVVVVTHNPNLAVVCDADQIIHAWIDRPEGNRITYTAGAIEDPEVNTLLVDVLEGTWPAFSMRERKYLEQAS